MPQEEKNKLKPGNEDFDSMNIDAKCGIQNIGRYIDTDPYSYVSDLIINLSKSITKGQGLSQRGVNSLFLFVLTSGLLYSYTQFPQNLTGFFDIYKVPLIFLFYVFMDLLKNIPRINNFFMITFNKSDFIYCSILSGSIRIYDLEYYLKKLPFNSEQLMNITNYLIENDHFSSRFQSSLMRNDALYIILSNNYVKKLILDHDFTSQSVCIYLRQTRDRLSDEYLDELIKKYGNFSSVLFCIGFYNFYKSDGLNCFLNLGYNYYMTPRTRYHKWKILKLIKQSLIFIAILFFALLLFYFFQKPFLSLLQNSGSAQMITVISSDFFIPISCITLIILAVALSLSVVLITWLSQYRAKCSIRNYLKSSNLNEDEFKNIMRDINGIYD